MKKLTLALRTRRSSEMGPRMSCQNCGTVKLDKLSQIKYVRLVFLEDWIQDKVDEEVDAGIEN